MKNFRLDSLSKSLVLILFSFLCCFANNSFASDSIKYNSKSYFTGKNAIPLKKGEGYIQNTLLIYTSGSYSFIDNFDVSGGLFYTIDAFRLFAYNLNVRYAKSITEKHHISLGVNAILSDNIIRISPIVKGTYGTRANNFTIGLGYTHNNVNIHPTYGSITKDPMAYLEISGKVQIHKYLSIISENRFKLNKTNNLSFVGDFPQNSIINLTGIRIHFYSHNIDIACGIEAKTDDFNYRYAAQSFNVVPIPYLSYAFEF